MNPPDVNVTVEGGVADVQVNKPGVTVEVRDYDVDGVDDDQLWTDENGDRCVRYLVTHDVETPSDQQKAVEQSNTP
ncbi:MAG: hypothetical protein KAY37_11695 [Phycisphaerae bacterium]|nr:hypothetical protein [Phycisphaerae bacterium]